jgi:hypothetical protein
LHDKLGQQPLAQPDIGRVSLHCALRQIAERAQVGEDFAAARLQAQRSRGRRRTGGLVEDLHRDPAAAQIASQRQSSGTGADDQDVVFVHFALRRPVSSLFSTPAHC